MYKSIVCFVCAALLLLLFGCTNEPELPPSTAATAPTMTETEAPATSEPATEPTTEPAASTVEPVTGPETTDPTTAASTTAKPTTAKPTEAKVLTKSRTVPAELVGTYFVDIAPFRDCTSLSLQADGTYAFCRANGTTALKGQATYELREESGKQCAYLLNLPENGKTAKVSVSDLRVMLSWPGETNKSLDSLYSRPSLQAAKMAAGTWRGDEWFAYDEGAGGYRPVSAEVSMTVACSDDGTLTVQTTVNGEAVEEYTTELGHLEQFAAPLPQFVCGLSNHISLKKDGQNIGSIELMSIYVTPKNRRTIDFVYLVRVADWEEYVVLRDMYSAQ